MGSYTTTTGKVKVSLALDPDAYRLLKEMAPHHRAYGKFLSDLIRAEAARCEQGEGSDMPARVERLENLLAKLAPAFISQHEGD